jgi:hypothetical protein
MTKLLLIIILIIKLINAGRDNLCKVYNLSSSPLPSGGGNGQNYFYKCNILSFTAKLENNQVFVINCNIKNLVTSEESSNLDEELSSLYTTIGTNITQLTVKNCQIEYVTLLVMMYPALVGNITTISFKPSKRDKSYSQLPGPLVTFNNLKKVIFTVSKDGFEDSSEGMYIYIIE